MSVRDLLLKGNGGADVPTTSLLVRGHYSTYGVRVIPWSSGLPNGSETSYSNQGHGRGAVATKDTLAVLWAMDVAPYLYARAFKYGVYSDFGVSGTGGYFTIPGTIAAAAPSCMGMPHSSDSVLIGYSSTPYIDSYVFDSLSGFGARQNRPTLLAEPNSIVFNADDTLVAICYSASPYLEVYNWDAVTGLGAKFAAPTNFTNGANSGITDVKFTPDSNYIMASRDGTYGGVVSAFEITASAFTGTVYHASLSGAGGIGRGVAVDSTGTVVFLTTTVNAAPFIAVRFIPGVGWGTTYASPTGTSASQGSKACGITALDRMVLFGHNNQGTGWMDMYPWDIDTGFGTLYDQGNLSWATQLGEDYSLFIV